MPKAIITVGVSNSGKTTWADRFIRENEGWVKVERDCIRRGILQRRGISAELDWSKWRFQWERDVTDEQVRLIEGFVSQKKNIIISDTNLHKKHRQKMVDWFKSEGYEVEVKTFPITWELAVQRVAKKKNSVGVDVLANQFKLWNKEFRHEYYPKKDSESIVLVDCDFSGADKEDIELLATLIPAGKKVVGIMKTRDDEEGWVAEDVARNHGIDLDDFMLAYECKLDCFVLESVANHQNIDVFLTTQPTNWRTMDAVGIPAVLFGNPYK